MQPSAVILAVAVSMLVVLQVVPSSLSVSLAQTGITGAVLVWFVGFALKRA